MTTYHLALSSNKTQKRQKSINLIVSFDRTTRRIIPTKIHVLENQWDKAGERVIRHWGAAVLNAQLADIRKKMSAHLARHTFLTHIEAEPGNVFTVMSLGGGAEGGRPHDIRRNATGSPPRIPRKMDTAMTYIRLAEQDNRKALAESVGKQKMQRPVQILSSLLGRQ